tara:strand:+ start:4779 stop:4973 length:195 start_codon:yes stop_codon:yes gene_type:complete
MSIKNKINTRPYNNLKIYPWGFCDFDIPLWYIFVYGLGPNTQACTLFEIQLVVVAVANIIANLL